MQICIFEFYNIVPAKLIIISEAVKIVISIHKEPVSDCTGLSVQEAGAHRVKQYDRYDIIRALKCSVAALVFRQFVTWQKFDKLNFIPFIANFLHFQM